MNTTLELKTQRDIGHLQDDELPDQIQLSDGQDGLLRKNFQPKALRARQQWSQALNSGAQVLIRPISKFDAKAERAFIEALSSDAMRMRFMGQMPNITEQTIAQLTDLDGINDVALVAVVDDAGREQIVGVGRYSLTGQSGHCECALTLSLDWQRKGLGWALMMHLIALARSRGLTTMESMEFADNLDMRALMKELEFSVCRDPNDARQVICTLALDLS